jgi:type VI secretion system protein ImpH
MGREPGEHITDLMADLSEDAASFSVFYAIYLCETLLKSEHPGHHWDMLEQHGLEFRPYEHYVYKSRNIRAFRKENEVMKFVISFMGLYGGDSPLPRCYHEQVATQQRIHGAEAVPLQNFLDIFNNRFYWLYYQAWKKYRFFLHVSDEPENKAMEQVSSFIGQGAQFRNDRLPVSRFRLLQLSGVLCQRVRSKEGLLIVLREFFSRFKIDIEEFVRSMVKVENRPRMGSRFGGDSARLGTHCLLGQWVADYTSRICLVIGPLDFETYLAFLPGGQSAQLLRYLLRLYLNDSLEYDVKLIVYSEGVKQIPWNDRRLKLGQSLWLGQPKTPQLEKYYRYEEYAPDGRL